MIMIEKQYYLSYSWGGQSRGGGRGEVGFGGDDLLSLGKRAKDAEYLKVSIVWGKGDCKSIWREQPI